MPPLFSVMQAFGPSMHVGRHSNQAKTDAVFYPSSGSDQNQVLIDSYDIEVDVRAASSMKQF